MPIPTIPASSAWPSLQDHFDAVKATLMGASARPYGYGDKVTDKNYTLVTVSPRTAGEERVGGVVGIRAIRITTLAVGFKDASAAYEIQRRVDAALREQPLTIGAFTSSPVQFEAGDPVTPDGDLLELGAWFSASASWTYTV